MFVALVSGVLVAGGGAVAVSACSSTTDSPAATQDAATPVEAGSDGGRRIVEAGEEEDGGTPTRAQCQAACADEHPSGPTKSKAIDSCWEMNCNAPCLDGPENDAGADAEAGALDGGGSTDPQADVCGLPATTGDVKCNHCTEAYCCGAWTGCFGDEDCNAYVLCLNDCP